MEIYNISDSKQFMNNKKTVFVTGVTGQDGSHMVDYLLKNTDYTIFGGARRLSIKNHENLHHLENESRFKLINFDLSDAHSISKTIEQIKPDYFINLAAQTFVGSSWDFPAQTWECNTTGIIHILEAIRQHKPTCRFYNAGSSEEYGNVAYTPQDENHPARPRSPYGASKSAARQLVKVYRESYNMYAVQGLLFNHEGTRRGEEFVTRKITKGIARIKQALVNVTCGGAPAFVWPGGGITVMSDVLRMPDHSFGTVPTPAIIAPIEFSMRLSDYQALGGHMAYVRSLQEVLKQGSWHSDGAPTALSWQAQPQSNPWPLGQDPMLG
jgi:dTDP-4-dehydrorhamnose reductase